MPQVCEDKMTGNISRDCDYSPAQGVNELYLINVDDIDRAASTVSGTNSMNVDAIALKTNAKIYSVESIDTGLGLACVGAPTEYGYKYTHTQRARILDSTLDVLLQIDKMKNGRFVSLVKTVDGSSEENTYYKLGGWSFGMKMNSDTVDFDADSGTRPLEFVSQEGSLENTGYKVFLMDTLANTEAWIASNLHTV